MHQNNIACLWGARIGHYPLSQLKASNRILHCLTSSTSLCTGCSLEYELSNAEMGAISKTLSGSCRSDKQRPCYSVPRGQCASRYLSNWDFRWEASSWAITFTLSDVVGSQAIVTCTSWISSRYRIFESWPPDSDGYQVHQSPGTVTLFL